MDRRAFLRRSGLVAAGAAAGVAGTAGADQLVEHDDAELSGHAVGDFRPAGVAAATIVYRWPTTEPVVALTIDDGPSRRYTSRVLDILDEKNVEATFFQMGKHVRAFPDLAQRAAQRHEIGNHTWSHPSMALGRPPSVTRQLGRTAQVITHVTGRAPTLFRPPYGYFSGATAMVAAGMRYSIVLWDVKFNVTDSSTSNIERIAGQVVPGSIILGHDGGTMNNEVVVQALPGLIDAVRQRGLRFVTVTHLLASPTTSKAPSHL
ncbi:MAG TPA: polysaccharide deacetylase family protein [Jatrophihabitantaceae bacterium]